MKDTFIIREINSLFKSTNSFTHVLFDISLTASVLYTSEDLDLRSRAVYVLSLGSSFYREGRRIYMYINILFV